MGTLRKILLVDDDDDLREALSEQLVMTEDFDVFEARTGAEGMEKAKAGLYDLVILDVMLPGASGFDVLRSLRQSQSRLPVIMLTARGEAVDRILGLELGADDYLAKPFDPRELAARLRAIHRRSQTTSNETTQTVVEVGQLRIDEKRRRATWSDTVLDLTAAELRIITILAKAKGQPLERGELTEQALGRKLTPYDRSIDTHVSNLRRKLTHAGASGIEIRSVRGTGYELLSVGAP